jgi:hypothetical protein
VIMEDIRQQDIRRPHLVVGGVGAGKTAVLVRLTKLLADRGAIPAPIRLRDAKNGLDFRELAYNRFRVMSERRVLSTGEAEKVWRQLSNDDKIVVLADGLEEALTEGSANQDRDNLIRLAIHRARELGLPHHRAPRAAPRLAPNGDGAAGCLGLRRQRCWCTSRGAYAAGRTGPGRFIPQAGAVHPSAGRRQPSFSLAS